MNKNLLEVSRFDVADYLEDETDIKEYLEEIASENDPQAFLRALGTIARSKGMTQIARATGIPRESLYQSISEKGNPNFRTLWKVAEALGYEVVIRKKAAA